MDEHGVMLLSDYANTVLRAAAMASGPGPNGQPARGTQAVADNFVHSVVPSHADVSISHHQLQLLLQSGRDPGQHSSSVQMPQEATTTDQQVSALLNLGALARHPVDSSAYMLNIPGAGPLIKSILAGE